MFIYITAQILRTWGLKREIDGEKNAQISIAAKKTITQRRLQIMIMEPKQTTHYNCFVVFSSLCSYYVTKELSQFTNMITPWCYCYDQKTKIAFTGSYNFI